VPKISQTVGRKFNSSFYFHYSVYALIITAQLGEVWSMSHMVHTGNDRGQHGVEDLQSLHACQGMARLVSRVGNPEVVRQY